MADAGRVPLQSIEGRSGGPHLLITGGIHGDEFESVLALHRLLAEINRGDLRGRLTVVPCVNREAMLLGQRATSDGLDLARIFPGRRKGAPSEQIAHTLSASIRSADYYIDLHSGGHAFDVLPFSGYVLHPRPEVLKEQRRMAKAFNLPFIWGTGRIGPQGRTLSVARDADVPAIYAEYRGRGLIDEGGVDAYVAGSLGVMRELGMVDRPEAMSRVQVVIEDPHEGVANMQAQHPAPMDGLFVPAVSLGAVVRTGDICGWVMSIETGERSPVAASHRGVVVVLRALPTVRRGMGLLSIADLRYRQSPRPARSMTQPDIVSDTPQLKDRR